MQHSYSDDINTKKIAIIGIEPPPIGGISVHIRRVKDKFERQNNTVFIFDDEKRKSGFLGLIFHWVKLIRFLWRVKPDYVYHHTATCFFRGRLAQVLLIGSLKIMLGFTFILVDHVSRFFDKQNLWSRKLLAVVWRVFDEKILIGTSTKQAYKQHGIPLGVYSVEAAFLPPNKTKSAAIFAAYPETVYDFLRKHSPVLCANASKLAFWQGKDLYGFDLCLALMQRLKHDYPGVGLILALAQQGDKNYFKHIAACATADDALYLLHGCQEELWPLLSNVDLFVRPTVRDGASVSIEEALFVGTSVVASNICDRPDGVVLFKSCDSKDFYQKVRSVLTSTQKAHGYDSTKKGHKANKQRYYSNTQ